ncbi:MAG: ABC transporter permease [Tannerella sp.]|jgi:putative ABC transport system permease protein|nr:ABC transporter permease [Tannerella sp.]
MNRYLQYFVQAWNIIRQERLFSVIYIVGTGLSVTMVMALSIVFYIKIANIYPETNRDRLLVVRTAVETARNGDMSVAFLSPQTVEACFASLQSAEAVSVVVRSMGGKSFIQPDGTEEQLNVALKYVDGNFWTVFPFRFVDGRAFGEPDVRSGIRTAVIAESLARRLFGTAEAEGRVFSLDFEPCRVCGVVRDASFLTDHAFAEVWMPYTLCPGYDDAFGHALGRMAVYILAPTGRGMDGVRQEVAENVRRYNLTLGDEAEFSIAGQPDTQWQTALRPDGTWTAVDFGRLILQYALVFLVLLLVPAVSLSGMTHSRMERRMAETGVRRAFGATARGLMMQIVTENLLFTLLGGAVGLLASYALVALSRGWMMQLMGAGAGAVGLAGSAGVVLSPSMLLNWTVFLIALAICFVLNLLSSLVPAWIHSRRAIVHSLNR